MIKKAIILASCICLILTGCNAAESKENTITTVGSSEEIITSETTAKITEASMEEVTEASSEEVTEAPVEEVTKAPVEEVTEAPVEEVTEATAKEITEAPVEEVTEAPVEEVTEAEIQIIDHCVLTEEAVDAAHPYVEYRTEEEVRELLSILTDEELKELCPTDEDLEIFIQMAMGRDGNMFRDVTLDSIAKATSDCEKYYTADCDIVFDHEGNEGVPVTVYYSKPEFLVYDWSLLVADAFGYDAAKIKAFCESDDYEAIKTATVHDAREILKAHGGDPADWA